MLGRKAVETKSPENDQKHSSGSEHQVAKFFLAIVAIVLAMIWFAYYKGPSGQSFDLKDFIVFWLKELILLAFVVVALVIAGIGWLRRRIHQHRRGNNAS